MYCMNYILNTAFPWIDTQAFIVHNPVDSALKWCWHLFIYCWCFASLLTKQFGKKFIATMASQFSDRYIYINKCILIPVVGKELNTWQNIWLSTIHMYILLQGFENIPILSPGAIGIYRCHGKWTSIHVCGKMSHPLLVPGTYWHYNLL